MSAAHHLKMAITDSLEKFKAIPETAWSEKSRPEKWSKKEILGHLVDSAMTNLRRFVYSQFRQNERIIYLQDEWVAAQNYQQADTRELITLWELLNLQIVRTLENIPPGKLSNTCDTGNPGPELHTLQFLADDYVVHMKHHLSQILSGTMAGN
jgi:hypothetical protein